MIALLQRVSLAKVWPKDEPGKIAQIGPGLCILLGVAETDTENDANKIAEKITKLRIFSDSSGKMNLDIKAVNREVLLISQFTLIADLKGQNRPSFIKAAKEDQAKKLYQLVADGLAQGGIGLKTGFFGEYMEIDLKLDGPVTISLDSQKI